jgi:formylmethanofuran dehydrogenase subunit E
MNKLWTKDTTRWSVEIQVGEAWVLHEQYGRESAARQGLGIISADPAVTGARLLMHDVRQECYELEVVEKGRPEINLAPRMKSIGKRPCPKCGEEAVAATDVALQGWVVCGHCGSTLPG